MTQHDDARKTQDQDAPTPDAQTAEALDAGEPVAGTDEAAREAGIDAEAEVEQSPEERITALEAEVERYKTEYLRALAEAQNTKRQADKRIEDNSKYAVSNFAKELLGVADNLGRALMAAPADARQQNEMINTLAVGVEMTERELQSALSKYGIKRVDSLNQAFDPHLHQAMQEVERTDVPQGTVVQVYQDAYVIHDRLLRPAMVVVSRGGPKREEAPADAPQGGAGVDRSV